MGRDWEPAVMKACQEDGVGRWAGIALHAQESVFEATAFQVRLELFSDEVGERDSFGFEPLEKPREVLFDEGVEGSLLRAVTFVCRCVAGQSQSRVGDHVRRRSWAWRSRYERTRE